jgi:hypothetical protein|tara:strand:- start:29 stop:220 length:192 start_codon:yes stop_codon:yes gene_type:complete
MAAAMAAGAETEGTEEEEPVETGVETGGMVVEVMEQEEEVSQAAAPVLSTAAAASTDTPLSSI